MLDYDCVEEIVLLFERISRFLYSRINEPSGGS
jgi:hypothetical protein